MTYLPFWLAGLLLASVPILHWFLLRRSFAVSGRFTALVDRVRSGKPAVVVPDMNETELIAALRAATAEAFGQAELEAASEPAASTHASVPALRAPDSSSVHLMFFVGLILGGTLSLAFGAGITPTFALHSQLFSEYFGSSPLTAAGVLFVGGMLVGAGTRMAGGCTSGHGLCGVSQFQPGSWLATASFFGTGVLTSFALRALA
jgi:uncharacterized membrane protein YedE/YeeE